MFRIDSLLAHLGQILALQWPQNDWKWWFSNIIWKSSHTIHRKLSAYTNWLTVQNWFAFGPCWPNFGLVGVTKWLKLVAPARYICISISSDQATSGDVHPLIHCWKYVSRCLQYGLQGPDYLVILRFQMGQNSRFLSSPNSLDLLRGGGGIILKSPCLSDCL